LRHKDIPKCGLALLLVAASANGQTFEQTFLSPPEDARVMMRWWWFGPSVTKPELLREMQQMKAGGIGGFEIQPVYPLALDDPQTGFRNFPYLSDEFLQDVRYANDEAAKLGLRVSLTLSSGWPYGGPNTPVTEAAGAIHLETTLIAGGETSIALPALGAGESLEAVFITNSDWSEKTSVATASISPRMLSLPETRATRMQLPATEDHKTQKVLWFISSRTGQQVKRAAVGAEGFVLDHFSKEATERHLQIVADPLMAALAAHPPYSVFSDSLEVYGADWTPSFLAEFKNRRGYDLRPYLPDLFTANPDEEASAVRWDWGKTLTELVDDNYLKPINAWATARHTLFRSQTYGDPAVSLSSNALVDLPEGEGPQWRQFSYTRWAASAAHVYGRPVVSAETWTWLHSPAFRATPLDMKAEADRFFLQGINQFVGHGWAYSPPSASNPGWRFYAAGVFNDHNPWWIVMPDVMLYMQRTSWALRQGEPANDIAVYLPEDDAYAAFTPGKVSLSDTLPRWITPALTEEIEDSGYNFDYIDGAAIAKQGIRYPVLLLPNVDRMSSDTLDQIAQYCRKGGKVIAIGHLPEHAPGLKGIGEPSVAVQVAAKKLFADTTGQCLAKLVLDVAELKVVLHEVQKPDIQVGTSSPAFGFIHRKLENADLYFLANTANVPLHIDVRFRSRYTDGEWLNADTGTSSMVSVASPLTLDLAPYESRLLLLHRGMNPLGTAMSSRPKEVVVKDLGRDWQLHFELTGHEESMPDLATWTSKKETQFYSGAVTYRKSFVSPSLEKKTRLLLNFGEGRPTVESAASEDHPGMHAELEAPVRDAAIVYVNGKVAGSLWHPPYEIDITSLIKPGSNDLEVRVANTAINEMAGEAQPDYRLLWLRYGERFTPQDMENLAPLPSGVLGPVRLIKSSSE
jgi:hypothetical protein